MFHTHNARRLTAAIGLSSALLAGCGSSGSSGEIPADTRNYVSPPIIGGSNSSSSTSTAPSTEWTKGSYEPSTTFANYCAAPRSGSNPYTGVPYPDKQGTVAHENHFLRSWSDESYLWYDELPDEDPNDFASPFVYFDLLKTLALSPSGKKKDHFHGYEDEVAGDQLNATGEKVGYGLELVFNEDSLEFHVAYVEDNSPASAVNIQRGMRIAAINGSELPPQTAAEYRRAVTALYFPEVGDENTIVFETLSGGRITHKLEAAAVEVSPVYLSKTLSTPYGKVGYMMVNSFRPSELIPQLIDNVNGFNQSGIDDLILDLRYNGGGYGRYASMLAYMTAGEDATAGEDYAIYQFNDKLQDQNQPLEFISEIKINSNTTIQLPSLNLPKVYVLSTPGTCSASEQYINGLRGIGIEVVLIGQTTCGKPYGFTGRALNCGTRYFSIDLQTANGQGFGNYIDGFEPVSSGADMHGTKVQGCKVDDNLAAELGATTDPLVSAALFYRENGRCPSSTSFAQKPSAASITGGQIMQPFGQRILRVNQ